MIRYFLCIIVVLLFFTIGQISVLILFIIGLFNKKYEYIGYKKTVLAIFSIIKFLSGAEYKIIGKENIINNEPTLIIANHRSIFDVIIGYGLFNKDLVFVSKIEHKRIPIFSFWMKKINCIFLDRNDLRSGFNMIIKSVEYINNGVSVFIFPEGTRNHNKIPYDLLEFKEGSFKIAEKTNCLIQPVAFLNTNHIFDNHKKTVYVIIGEAKKYNDCNIENRKIGEYFQNVIVNMIKTI